MCITMKYPVMLALETPLRTRTDGHVTVGRVAQKCEGGPLAAASAASPPPLHTLRGRRKRHALGETPAGTGLPVVLNAVSLRTSQAPECGGFWA